MNHRPNDPPPALTVTDFYDGLGDKDRYACAMDVLLYGHAFTRKNDDGTKTRVQPDPPPDWKQVAVPGWWES